MVEWLRFLSGKSRTFWSRSVKINRFDMSRQTRKILLAFLFVCAVVSVASILCFRWLNDYLVVAKPLEHADAIVLMAGDNSRDRLPAVADLFKKGVAPTILLTNDGVLGAWSKEYSRNLYQAEWSRLELLHRGVPRNAVVILEYTHSGTFFDALNTRAYVQATKITSLVIVTSDYHTRRTLWSFAQVFAGSAVNLGIYPAKPYTGSTSVIGQMSRFRTLLIELIKLNYYKFRHAFVS
jgi:uncharacterized SAM-binding protein YcdF (DUF218 family)